MQAGTATVRPGEVTTGWLDATELPTGTDERLPVTVVRGDRSGPILWVTGGVHGDEATGVAVAQDVVDAVDAERLTGTLVVVPVVNPAGLRRTARTSYYADQDPNRRFPDPGSTASRPPETQELVDHRLFGAFAGTEGFDGAGTDERDDSETDGRGGGTDERDDSETDGRGGGTDTAGDDPLGTRRNRAIRAGASAVDDALRADALVDLHTAQVGSVPFVIRDRVLHGERRDRDRAAELSTSLGTLVDAFDFPCVREYPAGEYLEERLQRSVAGSALNTAGIPAFTVELGGHRVVDEHIRAAGVAGVCRVAVELGMLTSVPPGTGEALAPAAPVDYPVRRAVHPRSPCAGLVRHAVEPGDVVEAGDDVATVVTPHGTAEATVTTDHDGYVLARAEGLAVYEGSAVASMAVRDDADLVVSRDAATA